VKKLIDRLEESASDKDLSLSAIAERVGVSRAAATRWRGGGGITPATLRKIASLLNVDFEWLKTGKITNTLSNEENAKHDNNAEIIERVKKVPLIDMVAAGGWSEVIDPYPVGEAESWEDCSVPHSDRAFAVRINGESMSPKFEHGEIIYCDPMQNPENKDYVIAKLDDSNEATFKQLIIEDGKMLLKALNPNWHVQYMPINGNCHIVGKVIARFEAL
jgi:SOS-response transcriptional repressor LexA